MIFVTGDTHARVERFNTTNFPEQREMTKDDYVIVCGDFGLVFDQNENKNEKFWLDWLENKPFTTLFVDGNHENFDRLNKLPVENWNGGRVHKVRPSVIHLMRGEVFNLQGETFFTFGGARSHDINDGILEPEDTDKIKEFRKMCKSFRVNHVSWWEEEFPSDAEMQHGLEKLTKYDNEVDYVITHSPSTSMLGALGYLGGDNLTDFLDEVRFGTMFGMWFFGHMHDNRVISNREVLLYDKFVQVV